MSTHYRGTEEEIRALDALIKLSRAADTVSLRVNAHLHRYQLTVSQFGVLEALFHLGPMQLNELGAKILKSSGNMTTVVDNLEKRALVQRRRREDDRRCIHIHLTQQGKTLIADMLPDHVQGIVAAFAHLTGEEQVELSRLCRKLGRGL